MSGLYKEQISILLSIMEIEYIAVRRACTQLLRIQQVLANDGLDEGILIPYVNLSALNFQEMHA